MNKADPYPATAAHSTARSQRGLIAFAAVLALLALGVSGYLTVQSLAGDAVAGCGGDSGCAAVLASPWSYVGSVPVSLLGGATYLAVLLGLGLRLVSKGTNRFGDAVLLAAASAMLAAAVWFTTIQFVKLGEVCPYCMLAHGIGVVLAGLLAAIVLQASAMKPALPLAAGVLGVGLLIAVQHLAPNLETQTTENLFVDRDGDMTVQDRRHVSMFGGALQFVLDEVPYLGRPDAEQVVGLMFDYACPHCRRVHLMIDERLKADGKRFVVVPLPMTIKQGEIEDGGNPYLSSDMERFNDSRRRAVLSLAVAAVDRDKWQAFDRWLFSPESAEGFPRSAEDARAKAVELIGEEALQAQLDSGEHAATVVRNIRLLEPFADNDQLRIPIVTAPGAPAHLIEGFHDIKVLDELLVQAANGLAGLEDSE